MSQPGTVVEPAPEDTWPDEAEARAAQRRTRRRSWLVVAAVVVLGAILVGVVAAAGGFARRRDQVTQVPVGTLVTTGPYELTFAKATSQYVQDSRQWKITVSGSGRTTGDTSISPSTSNPFLLTQNPRTRTVSDAPNLHYGDSTDILIQAEHFTPGLPPVAVTAEYAVHEDPGADVRMAVLGLELRDTSILGDQDPVWTPTNQVTYMLIPLTRLPDSKY